MNNLSTEALCALSPIRVIHLPHTESTNTYAKDIAKTSTSNEPLLIVADSQSGGRGRMGRSFFSPDKTGLYMSILLYPTLSPRDIQAITTAGAVAVCRAIKSLAPSLDPKIKWVNDIYLDGKKIAGILTEGSFDPSLTSIRYAVLGIGVNVFSPDGDFPEEIKSVAGALFKKNEAPSCNDFREKLAAAITSEFMSFYYDIKSYPHFEEYKELMFLTGKSVTVLSGGLSYDAEVLFLEKDLSLTVRRSSGETENLISGEVSLKIK